MNKIKLFELKIIKMPYVTDGDVQIGARIVCVTVCMMQ